MSKVWHRGGNESAFRTAVTTLGPGPSGDFPAPEASGRAPNPERTSVAGPMMGRLEDALASAENAVLWPVRRLRRRLEEDLQLPEARNLVSPCTSPT